MKVTIHQPCYLPYLGIFYKMWQSDVFVFLDDAQFSTGYVFNWNRIKTPQGECRIKIPIEYAFGDLLTEVRPRNELGWREKHIKMIEMNYSRARYFKDCFPEIREAILSSGENLADLCIELMVVIGKHFGIPSLDGCKWHRSSEMNVHTAKERRVIDIVKAVGGNEYISGRGAAAYQKEDHFSDEGIKLTYTDYKAPVYSQQWGDFIPNLSVIDFVLNHGYDWEKVLKGMENSKCRN